MWEATERDDPAEQHRLRRKVVDNLDRLERQINGKVRLGNALRHSAATGKSQTRLFADEKSPAPEHEVEGERACADEGHVRPTIPRFAVPQLRVCSNDLGEHALKFIPNAAEFSDIESYRDYLLGKLPFNSVATRQRYAQYLINRFFPGDHLHEDLTAFASAGEGRPSLGDVLFYLACRSETILALAAENVVWPALSDGGVARAKITQFVQSRLGSVKGSKRTGQAIARSYQHYGIGEATRDRLIVSVRRSDMASFAYILHLEFPEPGMHAFEKLLDGPMHKWLLWERDWIIEQLYACRQAGLLTKVSEIDSMRQFTTKYPLAEAMSRILSLIKEGQS